MDCWKTLYKTKPEWCIQQPCVSTWSQQGEIGQMHQCDLSAPEIARCSLLGIFTPLDKEPICESSSIGNYARVQNGQDEGDYPAHITMMLNKVLKVCQTPGEDRHVRQLLTTYADVFSSGEADGLRTNLVGHEI